MPIYNAPNISGNGIDGALSGISQSVSVFVPMLLTFIFFVVFITGYKKQRETTGFADAPLWGTIAGVITSITALLLSMGEGIINLPTLIPTIVITLAFGIWLFSSRDR